MVKHPGVILRIDGVVHELQCLVDTACAEYGNGWAAAHLRQHMREIMGFVVAYHQPSDYRTSELYESLCTGGLPSIVVEELMRQIIMKIDMYIQTTTLQKVHYLTHDCRVSTDGSQLRIERLEAHYAEFVTARNPELYHTGHTVAQEIRWATIYNS